MPKFPNAHLVLNSRDRTLAGNSGTYNNFILRNPGQNIVQGQMKDVAFSEIYFPYDIPNIQEGYNTFELYTIAPAPATILSISVAPGWYDGTELATAITAGIGVAAVAASITAGDAPTCDYDAVSNQFTFVDTSSATFANKWVLASPYTYTTNYVGTTQPDIGKDILSIMGYTRGSGQIGTVGGNQIAVSGSAPLVFTDYIDICSPALCQYQYLRDGSTTVLPRRVDLICRLYIANETSNAFEGPPGTRPFVIHRQFKNQRVMKNTAANAINDVDIQLYDDCGQPLTTTYTPRNFQITFHVYEADDSEANSNIGYRY